MVQILSTPVHHLTRGLLRTNMPLLSIFQYSGAPAFVHPQIILSLQENRLVTFIHK